MRLVVILCGCLLAGAPVFAQAVSQPTASRPPTLAEVRRTMGIPSRDLEVRGQLDSIGYAHRADQMQKVWDLAASPPAPESFGAIPTPGVAAVLCPHDDYAYAARVYRRVLPLVTARTVILVGVFHQYRSFGEHDRLVFDPYRAWRAPDGDVPISPLRDELLAQLPPADYVQDAAMHDSEHSLEAIVFALRHIQPQLEIVPIIVPAASFERLAELADRTGAALADMLARRGWQLGRDVAVVLSTDGVHYGPDFSHTPYGPGGVQPYVKATAKDRSILTGPLDGVLTRAHVRAVYADFVDPAHPDRYRLTWCGRFAVPFGLLLLERAARDTGGVAGHPVAYGTSVGWPQLPVQDLGLGTTGPASLYHFVGHPAAAFTIR